ncbi:MAG: hypothetical protein ACLQVM_20650 [Terriglobia bacterium]
MADDDKKSFVSSLPGILTGLAAVLAAVGGLIYHNQHKAKPKPEPAAVQQEATAQPAPLKPSPSSNDLAPPEGFQQEPSYSGDCASPPAGSACIRFRDGYLWLVQDVIKGKREEVGAWGSHQVVEATGKQSHYQHILGTQYVKTVAK